MPVSKNAYKRYRIIDAILRRKHFPSKQEILDKLEQEGYPISERLFDNDLEAMRNKLNLPVEYDRLERGYYYSDEEARLDVSFTDEEIELIWLAAANLKPFERSTAVRNLLSSIERLMFRMDMDFKNKTSLLSKVIFEETSFNSMQSRNLTMMMDALYHKRMIEITFHDHDNNHVVVTVELYKIEEDDKEWNITGYQDAKKMEFRLSKIERVQLTDIHSNIHDRIDF